MVNTEEALLAELAIEKYAEAKGLDVKTVKQKWLPILQAEKEKKDPFTESLINACSLLGQIKEVGKDLDPATKSMLSELSGVAVTRAIKGETGKSSGGDESFLKMVRRIKLMDHAFTDQDKVTEKIAERVSKEVAAPLAEALTGLKDTLEKITPNVLNDAEEYAGNPEFTELQQTMENVNTTLTQLADKLDKGGVTQGDIDTDVESMIMRVADATEKSKGFLEKQGFKIVVEDAPATLDEARKIVEARGYTLQDKRVTREEAKKMAEEAAEQERSKHDDELELKLEAKKIEAAKEITATAIDNIMKPLTYFLEKYLGTVFEGETPVPGANPTQQNPPATPPKSRVKAKVKTKSAAGKR